MENKIERKNINLTGKASIDKPWQIDYTEEALSSEMPNCTLYEYIYNNNKEHLNQTALEFYGKKITFGQMFDKVEECAKALKQNGVKAGDNVSMCIPGVLETTYMTLALSKIGACGNMLSPAFSEEQLVSKLNETESDILILLDEFYDKNIATSIEKSNIKKVVVVPISDSLPLGINCVKQVSDYIKVLKGKKIAIPNNDKFIDWKQFIKTGKDYKGITTEEYKKDTPIVMVYTSGTTGVSKGIVLTNDGFTSMIRQHEVSGMNFKRGQRCLQVIPTWFSTGICNSLMMPLSFGITVIFDPIFDKHRFAKNIKNYKPSHAIAPTSHWEAILDDKVLDNTDLSFLVYPVAGGEALTPRLEEILNSFLAAHNAEAKMGKGWGECELGSCVTVTKENSNKPGSAGKPLSHVIVSTFDTETEEELGYNQRGQLEVCTPCKMKEYYKNLKATMEFFRIDEQQRVWGRSGDIGYVDEEGFVFIEGRASDFILNPAGEKIYLFDIENKILEDEAVQLCEVIGMSIENGTRQIPIAHLVLKEEYKGQEQSIIKRIDEKCKESLSEFAVPLGYKCRDAFTATPGGKRDTNALKQERDGYMKPLENSFVYLKYPEDDKPQIDYSDSPALNIETDNKENTKQKKLGIFNKI